MTSRNTVSAYSKTTVVISARSCIGLDISGNAISKSTVPVVKLSGLCGASGNVLEVYVVGLFLSVKDAVCIKITLHHIYVVGGNRSYISKTVACRIRVSEMVKAAKPAIPLGPDIICRSIKICQIILEGICRFVNVDTVNKEHIIVASREVKSTVLYNSRAIGRVLNVCPDNAVYVVFTGLKNYSRVKALGIYLIYKHVTCYRGRIVYEVLIL